MNSPRPFAVAMLAASMLTSSAIGAAAQKPAESGRAGEQAEPAEAAPPPAVPTNAPFMRPLGRLATILGSVSFLRTLCGDGNASVWHDRMNDLIRIQASNSADKELLIASYNSGYRSFASVYRRCTPAARTAVSRYQEEGAVLSRDIASRYGN